MLLALLLTVATDTSAQNMELVGGNMTVASGTRIAFTGPLVWNVADGAQIVNDGSILLGEEGRLVESDASPITGLGTEESIVAPSGPLAAFDPGGLGLSITAASLTTTTVVRGHSPLDNNGTDQSIARWYRLEPPPQQANELDFVFRYASSELNGLSGSTLALYIGDGPLGPWTFVPSTANGTERTVSAFWNGPWASTITAFTQGISTAVPDLPNGAGIVHWPNPTNDLLWLRSKDGSLIETLELMDGTGRIVMQQSYVAASELLSLSLQALPSGIYFLRVNGSQAARVVKQ